MNECSTINDLVDEINDSTDNAFDETNKNQTNNEIKNEINCKINGQNLNLLDDSIYEFDRNILNDLDNTCSSNELKDNHVLYVLVVGFHHKKGNLNF